MKSSIKFLAVIALFFTFSFTSFAQKGERKELDPSQIAEKQATKMAEKQTARMTETLNLDEVQAERVSKVNLDFAKREKEATKSHDEAIRKIKTEMQAEKMNELKFVLTPTQFKEYTELEAAKKKRGQKGMKGEGRKKG